MLLVSKFKYPVDEYCVKKLVYSQVYRIRIIASLVYNEDGTVEIIVYKHPFAITADSRS